MPTYEYECQKCGYAFEAFQSMTDAPLRTCPECKGKVKRLLGTGAGVVFKGSGFYETDYKRSTKSAPSAPGSSASAKSESSTQSSTAPADSSAQGSAAKPPKSAGT